MSVLAAVSRPAVGLALSFGVVDQIARAAPHRKRRRQNRLDHPADRSRISRILGEDIAGRLHCAAAGVGENNDERRTEHGGAPPFARP
jgi:hypothetical protein